jgi:hypothetical protein
VSRRKRHTDAVRPKPVDDRIATPVVLRETDLTEDDGVIEASKSFFEVLRRFGAQIDTSTLLLS